MDKLCSCFSDTRAAETDPLGPVSEEEVKSSWAAIPETFEVEVAHASGSLGLDIGHHELTSLEIKAVKAGSVEKHNKTNSTQVWGGDFIVAVNGVTGSSDKLLEELKKKQKKKTLKLLVSRGAPMEDRVYCRLKCAWADDGEYFLNAKSDYDHREVQCYTLDSGWGSEKWWIHDAGGGYKRIQNEWTGKYLNWVEDLSGVALTEYDESYESMLWRPDYSVSTKGAAKYRNKYKPDLYLNMDSGSGPSRSVGLYTQPENDFLSAQWAIEPL